METTLAVLRHVNSGERWLCRIAGRAIIKLQNTTLADDGAPWTRGVWDASANDRKWMQRWLDNGTVSLEPAPAPASGDQSESA